MTIHTTWIDGHIYITVTDKHNKIVFCNVPEELRK